MTERELLGVGEALAQARTALGLTHADVAQQIKFMPRQIEALEAERFESLPGPTIARGMVRTYARFLKLDAEPLLERMAGHVKAPDATPKLAQRFRQPVPFSDGGRRSTFAYLALSGAVLVVAGGVLYEWRHERPAPSFVSPASLPEPRAQTASLAAAPAPAAEPAVPAAPVVEKPAVEKPVVEKPAPAKPVAQKPVPVQVKAEPPSAPKVTGGAHRLVLRFEEEAWVEVTDGAGRNLISSLNAAGSERSVRCAPPCSLVVGNAQHVRITYNDRDVDLQPHVKVEVARFTLK